MSIGTGSVAAVPFMLGLDMPNPLPESLFGFNLDWPRPAGRLIWSTLIFLIMTVAAIIMIRRPKKSAEPATWAAAIAGSIVVWAWLTLAYAVIPHEWLTYAAAYLNWGKDTYALEGNRFIPTDVTREAVSHIVVSGIYGLMLVLNVALFVLWQKRKVVEPAAEVVDSEGEAEPDPLTGPFSRFRRNKAGTSAYGRPVTTAD